ncbi:MAG TPA: tetratricopeptide repeat protein [Casimicrobiaceae bacterium]|nr:tetratricopeptide repeat protein [Casimicrobiaceae bacterium]
MSSSVATLLFTDIEGSTRLWEVDAEGMSRALARHDELSRAAVERHRGTVIKMTGDGMYAAFEDSLEALTATAEMQEALASLAEQTGVALRVRAGLHVGMVERRNDDLFGSTVNRAARIMKAAHGGQILVTQAVADSVQGALTPGVSLRDLGSVRLRDLATSEHVYQVVHPALRQDFPALRSLEATPNNLPQQATSFIGRDRELREAKALLESSRLLTLLGMGGLGKTRLSLQIAADVLERYPDGVWFLDLAPIRDPALVPQVAAQALGVHEEPGRPLMQTLCAHLRDHTVLFVLDNCEHLIAACASFAHELLTRVPKARMVATSREGLHIAGEQTYPVLPLAIPDGKTAPDAVLQSDAVLLFVERARLQRPGFAPTERDAPAIAELCARLEGIPLALELAAARVRSLSIAEINARLNDRFRLLTGGSRIALERQQTLRALVSWSYDLLQKPEQVLLDRLSCFAGGFDLEAAEAVCGFDPLFPEDVLDLVTSLVEKSLVMVEQHDDGSRYGMLETIREFAHEHRNSGSGGATRYGMLNTIRDFAAEKLKDGDDLVATSVRHCEFYLSVAKQAREKLEGPEQPQWTRRLETELGNLRSAISLALAGKVDPVVAIKFEVALMRFRLLRGYSTEARRNIRAALALPDLQGPTVARAHALYVGGVLATNQGDYAEANRMLEECLAIRRQLDVPREVAGTLSTLSTLHLQQGDAAKARVFQEEALPIFRALGERVGEGIALLNLGEIAVHLHEADAARKLLEQCLAIARSIAHLELESECERKLGELALDAQDVAAAEARFNRSLEMCRDAEDKRGEAIALWCLSRTDAARGLHESARKRLAEALAAFKAFEMSAEALDALDDYAVLLSTVGASEAAVRLRSAASTLRANLALSSSRRVDHDIDSARASLGDAAFQGAWTSAEAWSLDQALDYALNLARAPDPRATA